MATRRLFRRLLPPDRVRLNLISHGRIILNDDEMLM